MEISSENNALRIKGDGFVLSLTPEQISINEYCIDYPGEYEKNSVLVEVREITKNLVYVINAENKKIAFLPHTGDKTIYDQIVEFVGDSDICLIQADSSVKPLLEELSPRWIVPFGGNTQKLLLELGAGSTEMIKKHVFKSADFEMAEINGYLLIEGAENI